jgi:hypothetical protein
MQWMLSPQCIRARVTAEISTSPVGTSDEPVDEGISIARTGPEAEYLRRRLERSAKFGRTAMVTVGAIALAAGAATWITSRTNVGVFVAAFGGVLVVLGLVQHLLYRRDLENWPKDILLQDEGIEVLLSNGEIHGVTWSDPDLTLQLIGRPVRSPANREYLLMLLMESRIPPIEITSEGFDRLRKILGDHGFLIEQSQRGKRANPVQMILVRQRPMEPTPQRPQPSAVEESH